MDVKKDIWWWLDVGGLSNDLKGALFQDDFTNPVSAFSANWTTFGADLPTVSGGKARFDNGSAPTTWSKGVRYSAYPTNLNRWTISVNSLVLTAARSTSSFGVGVGLYSVANRSLAQQGIAAYIDLSTGVNTGKIRIGSLNSSRTFSELAISPGALAYSTNDVLNYTLTQQDATLTFTVDNITTGLNISLQFVYTLDTSVGVANFMHNRSNVCLFSLGNGLSTVESTSFTSNEYLENHYVLLGDSVLQGYCANGVSNRLIEKLAVIINRRCFGLSGQGSLIEDFQTINTTELSDNEPIKAVIIQAGTNNKEHSTLASYQTGIEAIVNAVVAMGSTVILCNLLPRNDGLDVRNFNTDLVTRYGAGGTYGTQFKIVDFFTAFRDSGTSTDFDGNPAYYDDTVHPNPTGFQVMANTLMTDILEFENGNLN